MSCFHLSKKTALRGRDRGAGNTSRRKEPTICSLVSSCDSGSSKNTNAQLHLYIGIHLSHSFKEEPGGSKMPHRVNSSYFSYRRTVDLCCSASQSHKISFLGFQIRVFEMCFLEERLQDGARTLEQASDDLVLIQVLPLASYVALDMSLAFSPFQFSLMSNGNHCFTCFAGLMCA